MFDEDPKRWRMLAETLATLGLSLEISTAFFPGGRADPNAPPAEHAGPSTALRSALPRFHVAWPSEDMNVLGGMSAFAYTAARVDSVAAGNFVLLAGAGNLALAAGKGMGKPCFRIIQTHFARKRGNVGDVAAKEEVRLCCRAQAVW